MTIFNKTKTYLILLSFTILAGCGGPTCDSDIRSNQWTNCSATKVYKSGTYEGKSGTYEGEFKHGNPSGQGEWEFETGDKYVGEFRIGMFHGQGTYTSAYGNGQRKYQGKFEFGEFHGQGTLTDQGRTEYVGNFKDGKYHGQGLSYNAFGEKYVGEFKDGKKHGQGTMTFPDNRTLKGLWENGEFKRKK